MDPEELKTHINAALEPLLQRIKALEDENQEIKAILKNIPQPKVTTIKPAPNPPVGNTTSTFPLIQASKSYPPGLKVTRAIRNQLIRRTGQRLSKKKNQMQTSIIKAIPSTLKVKAKHSTHLPTKRNVFHSSILEPGTKPTTAANNKKPNPTQPDPKKPGQTPHADKKTPGTTGRPSAGGDKGQPKGGAKVKTEASTKYPIFS